MLIVLQGKGGLFSLRMPRDIIERLLRDSKKHDLRQRINASLVPRHFDANIQSLWTTILGEKIIERGDKPQVIKMGRPEVVDQMI